MKDPYLLAAGPHRRPRGRRCAMEWVALIAGEGHTDRPSTVSPVLAAFARSWNDALPDRDRQRLRPYLGRMIGTAADGLDEWRAWLCADWLARTCAPALLAHAGIESELQELAPLVGERSARRAEPPLAAARAAAAAARRAGARGGIDGARFATRAAPRVSGSDAARAAVRAAPVARAERVAETACAVARDAAWAAAWRDGPAPWRELRPVVEDLQRSAFGLLDRRLPGVLVDEPVAVAVAVA
jgi:hypothetical protein